jgi:hypothetical protein
MIVFTSSMVRPESAIKQQSNVNGKGSVSFLARE